MNITQAFAIMALAAALVGCGSDDDNDNDSPADVSNRAPSASDASFTTQADISLEENLVASDPDGDALSYELESDPMLGSVELQADGSFVYQPNATLTGSDEFTFSVSDGVAGSDTATVVITIEPQQVSFSSYSRQAFEQDANDEPLPVNGREFEQDVTEPSAYDDLLP